MTIVAFDTAISTGIAYGVPGSKPRSLTVNLGKVDWDVRFARILRLVDKMVTEHKPSLIAVEAPAAGDFVNQDLVGLVTCVRAQAARMGVPVKVLHADTVRKHFTGRAWKAKDFPALTRAAAKKAIKQKVIDRCKLLGWDPKTDDEADALSLWDLACTLHSPSHQLTSLPGMFSMGSS